MTTLLQLPFPRIDLVHHSRVLTRHYPASSKLETESHSHSHPIPTTDYPYLITSLMQSIEDSNGGKHSASQRKMLWVEEGRGE